MIEESSESDKKNPKKVKKIKKMTKILMWVKWKQNARAVMIRMSSNHPFPKLRSQLKKRKKSKVKGQSTKQPVNNPGARISMQF